MGHKYHKVSMQEDFFIDPRDDGKVDRPQPIEDIKILYIGGKYLKVGSKLTGFFSIGFIGF